MTSEEFERMVVAIDEAKALNYEISVEVNVSAIERGEGVAYTLRVHDLSHVLTDEFPLTEAEMFDLNAKLMGLER